MNTCSENNNSDLLNLKQKITLLCFNNIKWSCLYSGMGIIHSPSKKDTKKLLNSIKNNDSKKYENIVFLKCIYKKGRPLFASPSDEIINPGKHMWEYSKFDKYIPISSQAFAILSLCKMAQYLYSKDIHLGLIMLYNAKLYFNFINTYLQNEEGLFTCAQDKTKNVTNEIKIKQDSSSIDIINEIHIHEAFLMLYSLTCEASNKEYFDKNYELYLKQSRLIFEYIYSNYLNILSLPTKHLVNCILSFSRCYEIENDENQKLLYNNLIVSLCAELDSRIKITGEIEESINNNTPASFMTHIRSILALLEGYKRCNINKFLDLAFETYKYVDHFFDENLSLYVLNTDNEIKYSIKDISEICCTLYSLYSISDNINILKRLNMFYEFALQGSGVIESMDKMNDLFDNNVNSSLSLPYYEEANKPPVFLKGIKINYKEYPNVSVSKSFNSLYSLYASYILLFYFSPFNDERITESSSNINVEFIPKIDNISKNETDLSRNDNPIKDSDKANNIETITDNINKDEVIKDSNTIEINNDSSTNE